MVSAPDSKHMVVGTSCCPKMSPLLLDNSVVVVGLLSCCRVARVVSALDFKQMVVGTLRCPRMSLLL